MDVKAARNMTVDEKGNKVYSVNIRIVKIDSAADADRILPELYEKATELTGQTQLQTTEGT